MIAPVECRCGRRLWVEFRVVVDEFVFPGSEEELKKVVVRGINIVKVWEDDGLAEEVREQFRRLVMSGDSVERAVAIVSEVYGIPLLTLEEFLSDLIEEAKIRGRR